MNMKYLPLFIVLLTLFTVSCSNKTQTKVEEVKTEMVLSAKDTVEVLDLVNHFMGALKEKRYADAVVMLHKTNSESPYSQPEELDNDEIAQALDHFKHFPISDYEILEYKFKIAYHNEVKCLIHVEPASEGKAPLKLNFYLKPMRHFGHWYLSLMDK